MNDKFSNAMRKAGILMGGVLVLSMTYQMGYTNGINQDLFGGKQARAKQIEAQMDRLLVEGAHKYFGTSSAEVRLEGLDEMILAKMGGSDRADKILTSVAASCGVELSADHLTKAYNASLRQACKASLDKK